MSSRGRRRLLGVLLALSLSVIVLDLSGSGVPGRLRTAAATALGPVQRLMVTGLGALGDGAEAGRLRAENASLRAELVQRDAELAQAGATARLLAAPSTTGAHAVPTRVVAYQTSALGGRTLTIDVGQHDGISRDLTVVAEGGLVGRVVSVAPWTSDVRVLGGADVVVAVRVGGSGLLATVSATSPPDSPSRPSGTLSLTLLDPGPVRLGDVVRTLGSVGGRPYLPNIVVGTVSSVDPPRGGPTATAVVRPAVDPSAVETIAVLLAPPRDVPPVAGGG